MKTVMYGQVLPSTVVEMEAGGGYIVERRSRAVACGLTLLLLASIIVVCEGASGETQWQGYLPSVSREMNEVLSERTSDAGGNAEISLSATLDRVDVYDGYYDLRVQTMASANVLGVNDYDYHAYGDIENSVYRQVPYYEGSGGGSLDLSFDGVAEIDIPAYAAIPYFGKYYARMWVSENGFITFGNMNLDNGYPSTTYTLFPDSASPNGIVAPLWTDLDMSQGGTILYGHARDGFGNPLGDTWEVMWYEIPVTDYDTTTFKIRFNENGNIFFFYNEVTLLMSGDPEPIPLFSMGFEDQHGLRGYDVDWSLIDDNRFYRTSPNLDSQWKITSIEVSASKHYDYGGYTDYEASLSVTGIYDGERWGGMGVETDEWPFDLGIHPYNDADHATAATSVDALLQNDPVGKTYDISNMIIDIGDFPAELYPATSSEKYEPGREDPSPASASNYPYSTIYGDLIHPLPVTEIWTAPVFVWRLYDDTSYTPGGIEANIHCLAIYASVEYEDYFGNTYTLVNSQALQFSIDASNSVPQAYIDEIDPNPAIYGSTTWFYGHGADLDGLIVAHNWRSSLNGQLSTSEDFGFSNLISGTHIIYYKVQDNEGAWSPEVTMTLEVLRRPVATIDTIQPDPAIFGQTVTFQGHGYDPDGTIVAWQWWSNVDGVISTSEDFSANTLSVGLHTIGYKVLDNDNLWSSSVWYYGLEILEGSGYPPTAITDLYGSYIHQYDEIWLFWDSGYGADVTFDIYRATKNKGGALVYDLIGSSALATYKDGDIEKRTTYYYYVIAKNPYGESDPSNIVKITATGR